MAPGTRQESGPSLHLVLENPNQQVLYAAENGDLECLPNLNWLAWGVAVPVGEGRLAACRGRAGISQLFIGPQCKVRLALPKTQDLAVHSTLEPAARGRLRPTAPGKFLGCFQAVVGFSPGLSLGCLTAL